MDEPNLVALCPRDRVVLVAIEGYERLHAPVRAVIEGHFRDSRAAFLLHHTDVWVNE